MNASSQYDFAALLPPLLPKALAWAQEQAAFIKEHGEPLRVDEHELARHMGVAQPDAIRICEVPALPLPEDVDLREAALGLGMLGPNMVGLTLGHSIYICSGHRTARLVSHELRHVVQCEKEGSLETFLPRYLEQLVTCGYREAHFEIDAREHEVSL